LSVARAAIVWRLASYRDELKSLGGGRWSWPAQATDMTVYRLELAADVTTGS
jgi:hypothetical protein